MGRKILAMSMVLVMLLAFSACGGETLPTAEQIIDGAIQAQDDMRTYEFEMDMTMDMAGEAEGEAFEATIGMDYSGALDTDNKKMRMTVTASAVATGEEEAETALEAYLVDGTGYSKTIAPGTEPEWEADEFSEEEWEETWEGIVEVLSLAAPQLELLEAAEAEVIGSETVKGVDCYVLRLTPNIKQLWDTIMQQATMGFGGGLGLPEFTEEIFNEASYSLSVEQWVAKDTYFLMKVEIDTTIELTAEAMQVTEGEMTIDTALNLLAYNYNQPVSIELPPEAEEAVEY
jgi:hypothetical protein